MRPSPQPIRVSLVEDNAYVREGWGAVLGTTRDVELLAIHGSCEEAFAAGEVFESDVVVMDIGLPGMSGIDGVRRIVERSPQVAVVMCTVFEDEDRVFDAICAGAVGYLLKKSTAEEFIRAIRDAAAGGSPMTPSIARKVLAGMQRPTSVPPAPEEALGERERDVLRLLARGKSYASIGEQLFLSIDGVRYHIRNIYQKLQAHTRAEAVAKGIGRRLIDPVR